LASDHKSDLIAKGRDIRPVCGRITVNLEIIPKCPEGLVFSKLPPDDRLETHEVTANPVSRELFQV
jgi:hypothetical protein